MLVPRKRQASTRTSSFFLVRTVRHKPENPKKRHSAYRASCLFSGQGLTLAGFFFLVRVHFVPAGVQLPCVLSALVWLVMRATLRHCSHAHKCHPSSSAPATAVRCVIMLFDYFRGFLYWFILCRIIPIF